ncbi:MAG: calcium-binding protein [Hyphomicrobiales bacterium]|nr:calcium-binding protein [Hyphomicrobiales bacterium]
MVKFVAEKGVNFKTLDEIEVLLDGDVSKKKLGSFTVKDGNVKAQVEGSGFLYLGGVPFAGKITDIKVKIGGDLAFTVSKLNLKISDLLDWKPKDVLEKILKGDDTLIGSNKKDTLIGFKGDDKIEGNKGKDKLFGEKGDDNLKGGKGDDLLNGGKHDDKLNGGKGIDTYEFTTKPGKGVDTIKEFEAGETIALDNDVFDVGGKGPLDPDKFYGGPNATDAAHRIVYREDKGKLYYDEDGSGGGASKELFAKLEPGTTLAASDFEVI